MYYMLHFLTSGLNVWPLKRSLSVAYLLSAVGKEATYKWGKREKLEKYKIQKSSCKVMVFSKEEGRGGRCVQWLYKQKKRSQDAWHQACLSAFHMHSQTPHDWERRRWNCSARLHQISRQLRGSDPIVLHYEHRIVVGFIIFRSIKEQKWRWNCASSGLDRQTQVIVPKPIKVTKWKFFFHLAFRWKNLQRKAVVFGCSHVN